MKHSATSSTNMTHTASHADLTIVACCADADLTHKHLPMTCHTLRRCVKTGWVEPKYQLVLHTQQAAFKQLLFRWSCGTQCHLAVVACCADVACAVWRPSQCVDAAVVPGQLSDGHGGVPDVQDHHLRGMAKQRIPCIEQQKYKLGVLCYLRHKSWRACLLSRTCTQLQTLLQHTITVKVHQQSKNRHN
jgi:hypothetical protein